MANWLRTLDIHEEWIRPDAEENFRELAGAIAKKLRNLAPLDSEKFGVYINEEKEEIEEFFNDIANDEDDVLDLDDFYSAMRMLYDWGDTSSSESTWPPTKACWIKTFF